MTYVYKDPLENGYRKIKVSKTLHNSVLKHRKRTLWKDLFTKYEYYANDWHIRVEVLPTLFTKSLVMFFYPSQLILYGVANHKEIQDEVYGFCNPKKTGSFVVEDITGEKYTEVVYSKLWEWEGR